MLFAAGYASTYAAWDDELTPDDDVSVIFSRLYEEVTKRLEECGVDFAEQMQEKRTLYSIAEQEK